METDAEIKPIGPSQREGRASESTALDSTSQ